jgi:transcriptional regulator with XRE-family HTH domain
MSDSQILPDRGKLRRKRIIAGLDQADLAERAGLHQTHISLLERGKRGTTAKTLGILASVLGCDITDLMPDEKPERTRKAKAA